MTFYMTQNPDSLGKVMFEEPYLVKLSYTNESDYFIHLFYEDPNGEIIDNSQEGKDINLAKYNQADLTLAINVTTHDFGAEFSFEDDIGLEKAVWMIASGMEMMGFDPQTQPYIVQKFNASEDDMDLVTQAVAIAVKNLQQTTPT